MILIWRLFVLFFAFCAAIFAAGLVVVLAVMFPDVSSLDLGPIDRGGFGLIAGFAFIFVTGFALLPAMMLALVTETFRIRNLMVYALGGAAVGLSGYLAFVPFDSAAMRFTGIDQRELEVMVGAGILAGLVYWSIAGRNAGAWRAESRREDGNAM